MELKQQRQHLIATKTASIESFKKRKLETSSLFKLAQLSINNNKLSIDDKSNTKNKSKIWFQNESANETNSDSEKEDKLDKKDWEEKQSGIQQNISYKVFQVEIKQNKEEEQNLCEEVRKSSKRTQMIHNKSVLDLEKEAFKTYNIEVFW